VDLPAHRLERIEVEESSGLVECFADRFRRMARRDPVEVLLGPKVKSGGNEHPM